MGILAAIGLGGCVEHHEHYAEREDREGRYYEEDGEHIRVRAPFTRVDVYVPRDDPEETDVDVDVDVDD
jgi:hypothetical protein